MKKLKALVLFVAFASILAGGFALTSSSKVEAAKCCWVMVCGPVGCWEVCKTCPKLP